MALSELIVRDVDDTRQSFDAGPAIKEDLMFVDSIVKQCIFCLKHRQAHL
jgi:hypothetical protein